MNTEALIIDKDSYQLQDMGLHYYIDEIMSDCDTIVKLDKELVVGGCVNVSGHLDVGGDLDVNGYLKVGGYLEVGGYLNVSINLKVGGYLNVSEYLEVGGYLNVSEYLEVGGYLNVGGHLNVRGYLKVGGTINYCGITSDKVIIINTTPLQVHAFSKHLKIGCEIHRYDDWDSFTERELLKMAENRDQVRWFIDNKKWLLNMGD